MFSLSCSWLYKQVWWNEKFWVIYVTILCWTLWCRFLPNRWWNLKEYSISQLVPVFIGTDYSFFMQVSCESSFEYQTKTLISYSFFACVPNLMSPIPSVMISLGARTIVTLLPVGSCGIQLGLSKRPRLLQCITEGQIELCTKVWTITTELYQISTNLLW